MWQKHIAQANIHDGMLVSLQLEEIWSTQVQEKMMICY